MKALIELLRRGPGDLAQAALSIMLFTFINLYIKMCILQWHFFRRMWDMTAAAAGVAVVVVVVR